MSKLIIDRFEGNYAICEGENRTMVNIPKYRLPLGCKEGDCLILDSDGMYQKDTNTTKQRDSKIKDKLNRLFK